MKRFNPGAYISALVVLVVAGLGRDARADITWGTPQTFNDAADVNPSNFVVATAVTLYTNADVTVNNVTFNRFSHKTGSSPACDYYFVDSQVMYDAIYADTDHHHGFPAASADIEKLLSWGVGNGNHTAGKQVGIVRIGGLEVGVEYQIQAIAHVWYHDGAQNRALYSDDITDQWGQAIQGSNVTVNAGRWNMPTYVDPQYVLGSFTAADTNEEFVCLFMGSGIYAYMPAALAVYSNNVAAATPTVQNSLATNITTTSAHLNGVLSSTGDSPTEAWVFWGTTDGENTKSAWANTNYLGEMGEGTLTSEIAGLDPNTRYYYCYCVSNAAGEAWASPSMSFGTLAAPVVTNATPSDITTTTAYVNGDLVSTGYALTTVSVFWGPVDGEDKGPRAWESSDYLGVRGTGTLSRQVTGLIPGVKYYYRYYASNVVDGTWALASSNFTTEPPPTRITWQTPQIFNDPSDVNPSNYTVHAAVTLYTNSDLTVTNVTFKRFTHKTGSYPARDYHFADSNVVFDAVHADTDNHHGFPGASTDIEKLLSWGVGNGNHTAGKQVGIVRIGGLEEGEDYQIQAITHVWYHDGAQNKALYSDDITDQWGQAIQGSNVTVNAGRWDMPTYVDPQYVLGSFTAAETNAAFICLFMGSGIYAYMPAAVAVYSTKPITGDMGTSIMVR